MSYEYELWSNNGVKLKVGFIGFGEVSSTLAKKLLKNDVEVMSSTEGRSEKTKDILNEMPDIAKVKNFKKLAISSDILISAVTPFESLKIAEKYGIFNKGIFLDLNNISPDTTLKIKNIIENNGANSPCFVKGAIIGKVSSSDSCIYLSGEKAKELNFLANFGFNIKIISENVVDVAYIKILRSIYTKGVTALLSEVLAISEEMSLTKELFEVLAISEGEKFESIVKSRVESLSKSHQRKFEEMNEILDFLKDFHKKDFFDSNSKMIKATRDKFGEIK